MEEMISKIVVQALPYAQPPSANPSDTIDYSGPPVAEEPALAFAASPAVTMETKPIFSMSPSGNPPYIDEFHQAFVAASANPEFLGDRKKVEKATAAMKLPNPEDRVRAQLRSHAEKNLRAKAAIEAERTGQYVPPTEDDYAAYVEDGVAAWREKQPK